MKWITVGNKQEVPKGIVLSQINRLDFRSLTQSKLKEIMKNNPHSSVVVLDYRGKQKIMEIGRDVIPYSQGVGDRR